MSVIGHLWEIVNALTHMDVYFSFWDLAAKSISLLYPLFATGSSL